MDRFQMNRSGCRPYQYTCGMNSGMAGRTDQSFSDMAKQVPAMAYVPYQEFAPTFELKKALQVGTIFPEPEEMSSWKNMQSFMDRRPLIPETTAILSHGSGWNSRFHGNRKEGADKVCGIMKKDSSIL